MALDRSVLGKVASEQMEALDEDYGEDENVQIGAVLTIVEVLMPAEPDAEGNPQTTSNIRMRHNVSDPYRAIGLLHAAAKTVQG